MRDSGTLKIEILKVALAPDTGRAQKQVKTSSPPGWTLKLYRRRRRTRQPASKAPRADKTNVLGSGTDEEEKTNESK
jgi:hypothetical protein